MKKSERHQPHQIRKDCSPISSVCGEELPIECDGTELPSTEMVIALLELHGAIASKSEMLRFVEDLYRSIRHRNLFPEYLANIQDRRDIIFLIFEAIHNEEIDEAVWRCFIASHFGRTSASGEKQIQSAARFLCAFRDTPFWTWERVTADQKSFQRWIQESREQLVTLAFGNHRKYESQKPKQLWPVVNSFFLLSEEYGSPSQLIKVNTAKRDDCFDELFRRLRSLKRFGRTGKFDFLVLLLDVGLISDNPKSSYLKGATGPLEGAKRMWGEMKPSRYDKIAADTAQKLGISPIVMEDALCHWQK